jgi:hypothetical protein
MTFLHGLGTFLALFGLIYLVAELESRWFALGVCGVLFVWFLRSLREEARRP